MGSPSGLSPGSPNKYLGPNVYLGTVVQRNREPTGADYRQPETGKLYPYATLWVVGKDPTTGTQGDIWILGKIASNVADWLQIGSGGVGPLLTVTTDSGIAVPDGFGNMNFFGQNVAGSGIATSASGSTVSHQMDSPYALGDFEFTGGNIAVTRSNSGGINQVAVVNGSNTAGSVARMIVQNAGGSGGDVVFTYHITGGSSWTTGMDVSVGSSLVFCPSGTLTGTNVLVLAPGGNVSVPLGDFKVSRSSSGSVVVSEVANDSNTAGSDAVLLASVAGTSSGDPYTRYNVNGAGVWSAGIDNSDSDAYVISASAAPGSSNVLRSTTTGNISVPLGDFTVTRSNAGGANVIDVTNSDNTNAASHSRIQAVTQTSGGSPWFTAIIVGQGGYSWGMDRADNHFKLTNSNTFTAGTTLLDIYGTGEITKPLQPSFLGIANLQSNVVGLSATTYTVIFANQVFDRGSDFDGTTFTAPVTGLYQFNVTISMSGLDVTNNSGAISIVTTARTYTISKCNYGAVMDNANVYIVSGSVLCDMTAGQTATVTVNIAGAADTVDIDASNTTFSGDLVA